MVRGNSLRKTTLSKKIRDRIIHDDFIDQFVNCKLIIDLKNNKKICIYDPRLCNFMKSFEKYIKKDNPKKCIENSKKKKKNN